MRSDTQLINRALELVRDGLRSGALPAHNFDMGMPVSFARNTKVHCGTTLCIGGWAQAALKRAKIKINVINAAYQDERLYSLFYNSVADRPPQAGAAAIDRYLDGKEPWPA